ncbi:U5 small nuclear ribonucleoprotein helicase [Heracleum sosnowskyi]|uniref:U5 small nuclear ribonucleoprotein helicase n=1 Tax=Heracleum sosnowskyi TaxID=360622 RepID=A0AAD8HLJ9_9APIA|nr:U5 small nuclear ribonucleoprotein helicase [Heracleum sosnowskyi]
MATNLSRRSNGYTKLEIEDPEETKHRLAQFLIYKVLQQAADSSPRRRKRSWLRIRMCRLKIRIGKRMKKLRKGIVLSIGAAKGGAQKQVISHMKTWKRLFGLV